MICKNLILDFRNDIKNWGWFGLSLVILIVLSYIDSDNLVDSLASVNFLLIFSLEVVVFFDLISLMFFKHKFELFWIPFAIICLFLIGIQYLYLSLTYQALIGLFIFSVIFSLVLIIMVNKNRRGR